MDGGRERHHSTSRTQSAVLVTFKACCHLQTSGKIRRTSLLFVEVSEILIHYQTLRQKSLMDGNQKKIKYLNLM